MGVEGVLSWLFAKRRRLEGAGHHQVLMYTRTGCHLCDEAWGRLQEAQRHHHFSLEAVDVDSDPALVAQYGDCVPVVLIDGKVRFRGRVNPVLLARIFAGKS
jgi:hypothetical protein